MSFVFEYDIQLEAKGKTKLGQEVSFFVNQTQEASLNGNHTDYLSGKIVSSDADRDFIPEDIGTMTALLLTEYALRHALIESSLEVVSYTVSTKEDDVVVYFQPNSPTTRTTDSSQWVYAYWAGDLSAPLPPSSVTGSVIAEGIVLSWLQEGHYHGIRIYNDQGLLTNLRQGTLEWVHTPVRPNELYVYYLAAYNDIHESPRVRVAVRTSNGEPDTVVDEETGEVITSPYPSPSREEDVLRSFQSGTGDGQDLAVVTGRQYQPKERFTYSMRLKGYEEQLIRVYPKRHFQYRFEAHINKELVGQTSWRIGTVDGRKPFTQEGSGKAALRMPIDLVIDSTEKVVYSVSLNDDSRLITYTFEKSKKATTSDKEDFVTFSSSSDSLSAHVLRVPFYGALVKGKGTYIVQPNQAILLDEELPNPLFDPNLANKRIQKWTVILKSDNPNVKLSITEPPDYEVDDLRFLRMQLKASVINPTQAPWNPFLHSGYYYLNQSEHYLFTESNVQGQIAGDIGFVRLKFVYGIEVAGRHKGVIKRYSVSLTAEIPSDQKLHRIGEVKIKELLHEQLSKDGVKPEEFEVLDYIMRLGDDYPLSISSRSFSDSTIQYSGNETGEGYVYAQTTGTISEYIYNELKVRVDDENKAFIKPIPRQGAPVIVQDSTGTELVQTFFYDKKGVPTLLHTEEMVSSGKNEILLSYLDVDSEALVLSHETTDGKWAVIKDYLMIDNYIKLYPSVPPGSTIRATYPLLRSFYIDYNYDAKEDAAKIVLHKPELDETRELKMVYETGEEPYYRSEEINLNPLNNTQHAGFLYIANDVEPAQRIVLHVHPENLYANGHDATFIRATVKDRYNNPVSDCEIHFAVSGGTLEVLQGVSDHNGLVVAKYTASTQEGEVVIAASDAAQSIQTRATLYLRKETLRKRMTLNTSYPTIFPGVNEVTVTAHIYGENQETLSGVPITFTHSHGYSNKSTVTTNQFGAASIVMGVQDIPRKGIIKIRAHAPSLKLSVETVIRIEGFRDYHPDYYVQSNNLIDIYDRISARENLGIHNGGLPPENPELNDLWIDQSDILYLLQSYQLRDVNDRAIARENLGLNAGAKKPSNPWPNDLWVENETGKGES